MPERPAPAQSRSATRTRRGTRCTLRSNIIGGTYIVRSAVPGYAECMPLIKEKCFVERWLSAILSAIIGQRLEQNLVCRFMDLEPSPSITVTIMFCLDFSSKYFPFMYFAAQHRLLLFPCDSPAISRGCVVYSMLRKCFSYSLIRILAFASDAFSPASIAR